MPAVAAEKQCITLKTIDSPVGPLTAGATEDGICLLEFAGPRSESQTSSLADLLSCEVVTGDHPYLEQLETELAEYFAGRLREFTVPVVVRGTEFQESV